MTREMTPAQRAAWEERRAGVARIDRKVARLSAAKRAAWYGILEAHEYFDGELEIQEAYLDRLIGGRR
jgi:hypothetical protein